ncbi:MAG: helix-turn-helix domain-containing protein [Draconibacterium sp.]
MDIDREKFESYMERILEQIELLHKKTDKLIPGTAVKELKLLDNQDLCQLLNVDKRTLQRYRSKGTLKYLRIEGKTFYTTDQINNFIRICDSL